MHRLAAAAAALMVAATACGQAPAQTAEGTGTPTTQPSAADPSSSGAPDASTGAIPPPDELAVDGFARVVADRVQPRMQPSNAAAGVRLPVADAPPQPALLGVGAPNELVYILDGPVQADGLTWFLVGPIDGNSIIGPEFTGWLPAADGDDDWLVPINPCPDPPITVEDLTYTAANWGIRLRCFRGVELTLVGWYPELPPDIDIPTNCPHQPAFLMCMAANDIRPIPMSFYDPRNANRLDFAVDPTLRAPLPEREQWIEIRGSFDHPAAAQCSRDMEMAVLICRAQFVVNAAHPAAAPVS